MLMTPSVMNRARIMHGITAFVLQGCTAQQMNCSNVGLYLPTQQRRNGDLLGRRMVYPAKKGYKKETDYTQTRTLISVPHPLVTPSHIQWTSHTSLHHTHIHPTGSCSTSEPDSSNFSLNFNQLVEKPKCKKFPQNTFHTAALAWGVAQCSTPVRNRLQKKNQRVVARILRSAAA